MATVWNSSVPSEQADLSENEQMSKEKRSIPFPFGLCRICQDNATGVHYGVVTCEGCKGFFKRMITQGTVAECFFGGRCVVNIETRNRCKACRFRRCIEEGMSMESVKMGRIPKKIKEQALREKQQHLSTISKNGVEHVPQCQYAEDQWGLTNTFNDSSSSCSSSAAHWQSTAEFVPCSEKADVFDDANLTLSSLSIPPIFYTEPQPISSNQIAAEDLTASADILEKQEMLTVSKAISKMSDNFLVDYMFNFEVRYANIVLRTMKYLSPKLSQPFLIYELDFELTSFFRYLRWKMFKIYSKHATELQRSIQRMFGILSLGIVDYPGVHASVEQMWNSVQCGISKYVKQLLDFVEDTPGLNELNQVDLKRILTTRILDFWILMNYPLFYQGETYMLTADGLQYTRFFMNKFIGKTMTDALHEFSQRLHELKITQIEHSLIIPIVLCRTDTEFVEVENVRVIRQSYLYALYVQMSATRTEDETKYYFENILQIIDHFVYLDELYRQNIRDLVIEQIKTN